jgi:hypothetical protein
VKVLRGIIGGKRRSLSMSDILGRVLNGLNESTEPSVFNEATPFSEKVYWYQGKNNSQWRGTNDGKLVRYLPTSKLEARSAVSYNSVNKIYGPLKAIEPLYYMVGGDNRSPEPPPGVTMLEADIDLGYGRYIIRCATKGWIMRILAEPLGLAEGWDWNTVSFKTSSEVGESRAVVVKGE